MKNRVKNRHSMCDMRYVSDLQGLYKEVLLFSYQLEDG